jgi:hypothetical protein
MAVKILKEKGAQKVSNLIPNYKNWAKKFTKCPV